MIRVAFSALNHLDVVQRNGWYQLPGFTYPHIAGMDVAGEVVSVGSEVTTVSVGDRVVVDPSLTDVPDGSTLAGRGDLYGELGVIGATPTAVMPSCAWPPRRTCIRSRPGCRTRVRRRSRPRG